MKISPNMKVLLLDEIDFALKNMQSSPEAEKKLYFFSAIYGCVSRIINIEFDPELAFIHHVTNLAYNQIQVGLQMAVKSGANLTIPVDIFDKLERAIADLREKIELNEKTYPALEKIANIAFSATGNGYYLYLKGKLRL